MKKKLFFAAIAITALAGCTSNEYLGDLDPTGKEIGDGSIQFDFDMQKTTRAEQDHATSAGTLHNQFIVWGEKSSSAETGSAGTPVFINYVVKYQLSSANTTESNSHDWEYVGQTPYVAAKVTSTGTVPTVSEQTIKYWDYTNKYYTFTAISALPDDISDNKVKITKNVSGSTVYDKGYTVALKTGASVSGIYFSDRKVVEAGDATKSTPVQLQFRNLVSQVRFGFYETIPGYSVKITDVKFNSTSHTSDGAEKFGVDCAGAVLVPGDATSFTVTYDDGSVIAANKNKAKVAVAGSNTQDYLSTTATSFFGTTLGTTSDARTWENGGNYTKILPNPSNTSDLTLTISYTLTSTDGSGETIDITDATAKVPAVYAKWQSNYAYTYLFKITDNYGLYPITFDAVVITDEAGKQETITTVETPSITTYAKGVNPTAAATAEYKKNSNIYVVVDKNGAVQTLTVGTNAKLYLVTNTTGSGTAQEITEASVANALANGTPSDGSVPTDGVNDTWTVTGIGMKNLVVTALGVPTLTATSTIPAADSPTGVAITVNGAKFTPTSAGTYAFEYIVPNEPYTESEANAYNATLPGAISTSDVAYTFTSYGSDTGTPVHGTGKVKFISVDGEYTTVLVISNTPVDSSAPSFVGNQYKVHATTITANTYYELYSTAGVPQGIYVTVESSSFSNTEVNTYNATLPGRKTTSDVKEAKYYKVIKVVD